MGVGRDELPLARVVGGVHDPGRVALDDPLVQHRDGGVGGEDGGLGVDDGLAAGVTGGGVGGLARGAASTVLSASWEMLKEPSEAKSL